jgi:hypothetical protein
MMYILQDSTTGSDTSWGLVTEMSKSSSHKGSDRRGGWADRGGVRKMNCQEYRTEWIRSYTEARKGKKSKVTLRLIA